jgi:metal-dependent amidase/aminoacylase/carboxypeptidase family protein
MDWYVRSPTIETLQPLKERVAKCLEGGAMAAGCTVTFDWKKNTFADLIDNVPLLESYIRNAEQFGRQMTTEFLPGTGGGSTDMGLITGQAEAAGTSLATAGAVRDEVAAACAAGFGASDMASLARWLRREDGD